jgi:hypothetical protein
VFDKGRFSEFFDGTEATKRDAAVRRARFVRDARVGQFVPYFSMKVGPGPGDMYGLTLPMTDLDLAELLAVDKPAGRLTPPDHRYPEARCLGSGNQSRRSGDRHSFRERAAAVDYLAAGVRAGWRRASRRHVVQPLGLRTAWVSIVEASSAVAVSPVRPEQG